MLPDFTEKSILEPSDIAGTTLLRSGLKIK